MATSTKRRACQSAWPDLPWDLLGDVLSRLPSLADRVRLRCVCRPWRAGAKLEPPPRPQLPWLVLPGGAVLDISNNTTYRLRVPIDDGPCYSAGDNMFFHHRNDGQCSVVNGFSGAATPLPELAALLRSHMVHPCREKKHCTELLADRLHYYTSRNQSPDNLKIKKVAMASSPVDHHRLMIVAVLASSQSKSRVFISTCRPAGEVNSCLAMRETCTIFDIAFFQGKMYAHLSMFEELVAIDLASINGCLDDKPATPPGAVEQSEVVKPTYTSWIWPPDLLLDSYLQDLDLHAISHSRRDVEQYLVESNGKLLMVRRRFHPTGGGRDGRRFSCQFQVFEADLGRDGPRRGRWEKARSLDGRALFVGAPCSRSFAAGDVDGARGDCIYFSIDHGGNPVRYSGVYSVVHGQTIMRLMPLPASRKYVKLTWDSPRFPAWFFPDEVS